MAKTTTRMRRLRGSGSLYPIGRIWWIAYHTADGLRHAESSGSERKGDAERLLRQRIGGRSFSPSIATQVAKSQGRRARGSGSVYAMGRIWWIAYHTAGGLRKSESSGSTRKGDAVVLLNQRLAECGRGFPGVVFCDVCGKAAGHPHRDRRIPRRFGGTYDPRNVHVMCVGCHKEKSRLEWRIAYGDDSARTYAEWFALACPPERTPQETLDYFREWTAMPRDDAPDQEDAGRWTAALGFTAKLISFVEEAQS